MNAADYRLFLGDCLEVMPALEAGKVDAIICDLPYGTTSCSWDSVIPLEPLWKEYKRLIKPRGAIVLFGSQPFTSILVISNLEWFKYEWVWEKTRPFDIFNCKHKPLRGHESIVVFSNGNVANGSRNTMIYNPQGLMKVDKPWKRPRFYKSEHRSYRPSDKLERVIEFSGYPRSVLHFSNPNQGRTHSAQKPVNLLEYLVKTYTNPGDLILDNCFGSCTTGVACLNTGRRFIGIEKDLAFFEIGRDRMAKRAAEIEAERLKPVQLTIGIE